MRKQKDKKDKTEVVYVDDGSSLSDLTGKERPKKPQKVELTKKEKRAISRAMFLSALPFLGFVLLVFGLMYLITFLYTL